MLFTGDAEINGLNSVINFLPQNITVLKVPHHGANNCLNKNLLEKLNPEYSIISVGENKFGHPSLFTLSLLNSTKILRTDINNAILIKIDSSKLKILTYDLKRKKWKIF